MAHSAARAEGPLTPEPKPVAGQQYPSNPRPEIEFDGSVLQQLPAQAKKSDPKKLAPVKLIPPTPSSGQLTLIAPDSPPAIPRPPARTAIPPIIITQAPKPPLEKRDLPQTGLLDALDPALPPATIVKKKVAATPVPELPPEPQVMPMNKNVTAATEQSGVVSFPIKAKAKTKGDLNPSKSRTAAAPAVPDTKTAKALSASMSPLKTMRSANGSWWQENPEIVLSDIPYPKPRPAKGMASESFVKEARKNLVETYTIMKREGDTMPAIPKARVSNEKLPAPRLSVADIGSDPLASQLVDMSPEDVAKALNAMAPASGREQMHLARELSAVAKPRIVRHEGEWIRKSGKGTRQESDPSLIAKTAATQNEKSPMMDLASLPEPKAEKPRLPAGPILLSYKEGEVNLPEGAAVLIEKEILAALKAAPDTRIQIVAYAAAPDGKEATARRTSLSRALSVRTYLMSQGIDATRMDVRAMGLQPDKKAPADKVDMILISRTETGKKG